MKKSYIWVGLVILLIGAFLAWLFWASTRPLPGQKLEDLGREHVPVGTKVKYETNPPTSGSHYEEWTRAGVYSDPKDDRNLVHSLEHGYVILSYKCNTSTGSATLTTSSLSARVQSAKSEEATESGEASPSGKIDSQADCDQRKKQLEEIYNKKGKRKLIVVPRPSLDTNFALTAWNYIDKFDQFDVGRVERFIDAHLNNGPERTME